MEDNSKVGGQIIKIGLTEQSKALLEHYLRQQAPEEYGPDGLWRKEQMSETPKERWENAMFPFDDLPGLIDEIMACIIRALKDENPVWLLPALDTSQEARQKVCKARWHQRLWYQLFWPKYAK